MANTLLNEEAYFRVLKAFAAGRYDLKKEMLLAKLRTELQISDQRHAALRGMIDEGKDFSPPENDVGRHTGMGDHRPTTAASTRDRDPPVHRKRDRYQAENGIGYGERADHVRPANVLEPPRSPFQQHVGQGSRRPIAQARPAKRVKREGRFSGGGDSVWQGEGAHPTAGLDINELIGYKVERWWPENGGWFEGAITDYRASTGEHCIVYDMNTTAESYEWFNMSLAGPDEFRLLKERINIIEHAPKNSQAVQPTAPRKPSAYETGRGPPPKKPGRGLAGGRGRGRGERITASQANGNRGNASYGTESPSFEVPPRKPNGIATPRPAFIVSSDEESSSSDESSL